jgi:hypothetical protein
MTFADRMAAKAEAEMFAKPGHYDDQEPVWEPWRTLGASFDGLKDRCEGRVAFSDDRDDNRPEVRDA